MTWALICVSVGLVAALVYAIKKAVACDCPRRRIKTQNGGTRLITRHELNCPEHHDYPVGL